MHSGDGGGSAREPVADEEDLLRAILYRDWWVEAEQRVSSAAFKQEIPFSVDVLSMTTEDASLSKFREGSGLACFSSGEARAIGFDAMHEVDPDFPDNDAHAHVYFTAAQNALRLAAKKLAVMASILRKPSF